MKLDYSFPVQFGNPPLIVKQGSININKVNHLASNRNYKYTIFLSYKHSDFPDGIMDNFRQKELKKAGVELVDLITLFALQAKEAIDSSNESNDTNSNLIRFQINWLSKRLARLLSYLTKRKKIRNFIGKDVEGFIPYKTWPRPPSNNQLASFVPILNELTRPINHLEISYGS